MQYAFWIPQICNFMSILYTEKHIHYFMMFTSDDWSQMIRSSQFFLWQSLQSMPIPNKYAALGVLVTQMGNG